MSRCYSEFLMKASSDMRSNSESSRSIVETHQDAERPVFVMPKNQIIVFEESIDFSCTDVKEDSSLDVKQNQIIYMEKSIDFPCTGSPTSDDKQNQVVQKELIDFAKADILKDSNLDDKLITDTVDLISKLPHPVLHHMLGFLLAQETVPIAVLSKNWYQVWNTLPFIDFDGPVWSLENNESRPWLPYVDSILFLRKNQGLNVDKFRISSGRNEGFESYLDHWISTLTDLHVRDLCFRNYFFKKDGSKYYTPPENMLSVKSITCLELFRFRLDLFQGMDNLNWPLLRKLHLKSSLLSDDVIQNIFSSCRAIEDLRFESCIGLKVIKISGLVKLQKFVMEPYNEYPMVEIDIPSLQSFSYERAHENYCISIVSCTWLKALAISGNSITQDWFDKLFSMFPLLESLTVGPCYQLVKINISSCKLKYFNLEDTVYLVEANIDTPNLSTFVYIGTGALSWSLNASPQLKVNVDLSPIECTKVTNFLRMIGHFEVVRLGFDQQSLFFPEEIIDELIYSQCDLKNLLLDFFCPHEEFTVDDATRLLDNLFWIYSQLENLSIYADAHELPTLELLYKRLSGGEERLDCCGLVPIRCWRHFLKEVKFETVDSDESDEIRRKGIYNKEKVLKFSLNPRE